jgi:hypothetical protein
MINRKQLEALHRALPEDWTPRDDVRATLMELLTLPPNDRGAGEAVLMSLSLAGVAQHSNSGTLWRRGVLPPELSPLELQAAEDKRVRQEREEEFQRRERANRHAEAVHQAPERARAFMFIDQRVREWAALLGFTPEQIQSAALQLSDPLNVPPLPVEPPRFVTSIPPDAVVTAV